MRRLALLLLLAVLPACVVTVSKTPEHYDWVRDANVKPADSTCEQVIANARTTTEPFYLYLRLGVQPDGERVRVFRRTVVEGMLEHLRFPDTALADFAWRTDPTAWRKLPPKHELPDQPARRARAPDAEPEWQQTGGELDAMIAFEVNRNGEIDSLKTTFPSQIPALHDALLEMVRKAHAARAIPPIPDQISAPQRFELRLAVLESEDAAATAVDTVNVRFPLYSKTARIQSVKPLKYPGLPNKLLFEEKVVISFVVDTNGSIRPRSQRVLAAKKLPFVQEAARSIEGAKFQPAEYRGCALASHVHQEFVFDSGKNSFWSYIVR